MSPSLRGELDRLRAILATVDIDLKPEPPASDAQIVDVEQGVGIRLDDDDLRALWKFSNGSAYRKWFAVTTDSLWGCSFASVEAARNEWNDSAPYDKALYDEWRNDQPVDPRIR